MAPLMCSCHLLGSPSNEISEPRASARRRRLSAQRHRYARENGRLSTWTGSDRGPERYSTALTAVVPNEKVHFAAKVGRHVSMTHEVGQGDTLDDSSLS